MADLLQKVKKEMMTFAIMLIGSGGTGKSSMMIRYTQNKFSQNINLTTGIDFLDKNIKYKNKFVRVQLWDTSGQQIYRSIILTRYKRSNAVIFVYDMTDFKSIQELFDYWIPTAVQQCPENAVFAVFGNKTDRLPDPEEINRTRQYVQKKLNVISQQKNIELISQVGNCKQDEDKGIEQMMGKIIQKLYNINEEKLRKQQEQKKLMKERLALEKPPERKSMILTESGYKKSTKKTERKRCFG